MAYSPPRPRSEPATGGRQDGRSLRAERTRRAIVDSMLELLDAGNVQPTAEQIAERAGVSERSVFQHFPDREALFGAVSQRQVERVQRMVRRLPTDGPLEERLEEFVDQRARLLEAVSGVRRGALLMEPFSEVIAEQLRLARRLYKREVEKVFGQELDARPREERGLLLAALASAADWGAWESLRSHQGCSVARAREAMRRTLGALLRPS